MARDRGGPALAGQMLHVPDAGRPQRHAVGPADGRPGRLGPRPRTTPAGRHCSARRCGGPDVSPYAAPARASDLSGLPPAFIDVGSAETFRDEDVDYASRIWQAGGVAELHVWPGGFHGFAGMAPQAALSQEAVAAQLSWLRRLLAS